MSLPSPGGSRSSEMALSHPIALGSRSCHYFLGLAVRKTFLLLNLCSYLSHIRYTFLFPYEINWFTWPMTISILKEHHLSGLNGFQKALMSILQYWGHFNYYFQTYGSYDSFVLMDGQVLFRFKHQQYLTLFISYI